MLRYRVPPPVLSRTNRHTPNMHLSYTFTPCIYEIRPLDDHISLNAENYRNQDASFSATTGIFHVYTHVQISHCID